MRTYQYTSTGVKRLILWLITLGFASLWFNSACCIDASAQTVATQLPANTPIEHLLVLMQKNHSFDNYFGTYPGADGLPPDVCMPLETGGCIEPFQIGDNDIEMAALDNGIGAYLLQYNEGRMDGFVYALDQRNQDGRLAMGYYDDQELSYYWNIADEYVLFDRFFSSTAGGGLSNRVYWIAATSGQSSILTLPEVLAETPTIFDRLQDANVSWKFYVQNYDPDLTYRTVHLYAHDRASQLISVPLLNIDRFIDNPALSRNIVDLEQYEEDLRNGTLPQVAFMVLSGPTENPPSSLQSGQRYIKTLLQALIRSDYWHRSAFIWTYDSWGGWYDHVPPPQVDAYGYGFRVPALLVSPYAKRGYVDSTELDYTSILKFISDNWNLEPLAERDAKANSIINAFDFTQPPRQATLIPYQRQTGVVKPEPRREIIYIFYGAGILLAATIISMALLQPQASQPLRGRIPEHRSVDL